MSGPRQAAAPDAGSDAADVGESADDFDTFDEDDFDLEAATHEHYADGPLYDHEYKRRRADVNFYRLLARRLAGEGPIVELGCGTGRVTVPLLREGHQVVGTDLSDAMLARARTRVGRLGRAARSRATLVRADMRSLPLALQTPLVVSAFNAFEHLYTRVDLAAVLAEVRRILKPGGHLVFDVQNPDLRWLSRDPRRRWARTRFKDPRTGQRVEYSTNHVYDPVSQIAFIRFYYRPLEGGGPTRIVRLAQRKFFPAELEALLDANGFDIAERYGDFQGEPLVGDCESQVLVVRPRRA